MPDRRGKPVVVWSLFIGLWCMLRFGAYPQSALSTTEAPAMTKRASFVVAEKAVNPADTFRAISPKYKDDLYRPLPKRPVIIESEYSTAELIVPLRYSENIDQNTAMALSAASNILPLPPQYDDGLAVSILPLSSVVLASPATPIAGTVQSRWQGYAYSFIRSGSDQASTSAAAAQYGGGQSGVIITYRITGDAGRYAAIFGRAAAAHSGRQPVELAAGIRFKPLKQVPVSVIAERRFRAGNPDNPGRRYATAIYAAGSKEDVALPAGFAARGYAQGGVILGPQNGTFHDAGIRIDRPVIKAGGMQFNIGIGSWTGGQSLGTEASAARFDIGPALRVQTKLGTALGTLPVQITADWRFRIGGNARPKNGPAITVSSGF